jgi:hypothetical protein
MGASIDSRLCTLGLQFREYIEVAEIATYVATTVHID